MSSNQQFILRQPTNEQMSQWDAELLTHFEYSNIKECFYIRESRVSGMITVRLVRSDVQTNFRYAFNEETTEWENILGNDPKLVQKPKGMRNYREAFASINSQKAIDSLINIITQELGLNFINYYKPRSAAASEEIFYRLNYGDTGVTGSIKPSALGDCNNSFYMGYKRKRHLNKPGLCKVDIKLNPLDSEFFFTPKKQKTNIADNKFVTSLAQMSLKEHSDVFFTPGKKTMSSEFSNPLMECHIREGVDWGSFDDNESSSAHEDNKVQASERKDEGEEDISIPNKPFVF